MEHIPAEAAEQVTSSGGSVIAVIALIVAAAALFWNIIQFLIGQWQRLHSDKPRVMARATYTPGEPCHRTDNTKDPPLRDVVDMPWRLQLAVTNTGKHPLYLDRPSLYYKTEDRLGCRFAMDASDGGKDPLQPNERCRFWIGPGGSHDEDLCDIGELPREDVEIRIEDTTRCIDVVVKGEEIHWQGVPIFSGLTVSRRPRAPR